MNYNVYSKFDMEKHKDTYINYLEVMIDEDGNIAYAVPSHLESAIKAACTKLKVTREELDDMCPPEYHSDFLRWLCKVSGLCAVWNDFIIAYELTDKQRNTLEILKENGLYKGKIE